MRSFRSLVAIVKEQIFRGDDEPGMPELDREEISSQRHSRWELLLVKKLLIKSNASDTSCNVLTLSYFY